LKGNVNRFWTPICFFVANGASTVRPSKRFASSGAEGVGRGAGYFRNCGARYNRRREERSRLSFFPRVVDFGRRRFWAVATDVSTAALVPAGAAFRKAAIRSAAVERVDGRRLAFDLRDSFFPEDSRLRRSARLVAFSFVRFARLI